MCCVQKVCDGSRSFTQMTESSDNLEHQTCSHGSPTSPSKNCVMTEIKVKIAGIRAYKFYMKLDTEQLAVKDNK